MQPDTGGWVGGECKSDSTINSFTRHEFQARNFFIQLKLGTHSSNKWNKTVITEWKLFLTKSNFPDKHEAYMTITLFITRSNSLNTNLNLLDGSLRSKSNAKPSLPASTRALWLFELLSSSLRCICFSFKQSCLNRGN